ncbi:GGDEF domain-containing protein, partial [Eubacteriales bacterium OttesenSCG-928-N14]|nr:GGDEF domain-containing protein [Eubacteriales bacterium OttesenSCG-928-N14]
IERLEDAVGTDQLTGLPNRHSYQQMMREMDTEENLPLSILMGDVNGLKIANDTFGHKQGDAMLRIIARTLQKNCPPNGYVARIGGDEFIMILPQYSQQQAAKLIGQIDEQLAQITEYEFTPSIAMGSATKMLPEENLNLLINEADTAMYQKK